MSSSPAVPARRERLLPLDSTAVLDSTRTFTIHVLWPGADDSAFAPDATAGDAAMRSSASEQRRRLREHVSVYWDHQHSYHLYQRRLLREVGSTRGAVRFVGFPQVRPAASTAPPTSAPLQLPTGSPPNAAAAAAPTVSAVYGRTPEQQRESTSTATAAVAPPRALAAWNWIPLVAPYERLLSPSLLFSALLSPGVAAHTGLRYGTQPPTPAPPLSPGHAVSAAAAPGACVPAHWGLQTCGTLWGLHTVAAEASLPAQEVYVMCSGTMLYLDVVVAAGRVWAELEGLWGSRELEQRCAADLENEVVRSAEGVGDASTDGSGGAAAASASSPSASPSLRQLRAFLSQPAQTYSAMLQHVRVLLEALAAPPPLASRSASAVPEPLVPWIVAAMAKEEWTATTPVSNAATGSSEGTGSGPSGHSASPPVRLMRHAVTMWLARRGATVSATAPTGSRAVALPARDLCVAGGCEGGVAGSLKSPSPPRVAAPPPLHRRRPLASAASRRTAAGGSGAASLPSSSRASAAAAAAAANAFDVFAPRGAPRVQHPFALPPLPQDPALVALVVVWRRTLRRCLAEPDVLRLRLRQVILGCTGERCEELMREASELAKQEQEQEQAQGQQGVSDVRAPPASLAVAEAGAGLHSGVQPIVQLPAAPLPLTSDPASTSFCVLGPRFGEWLSSNRGGGGWCGFSGQLFRCVGPSPPPLPTPAALLVKPQTRTPAAGGGSGASGRLGAARRSASSSMTTASSPSPTSVAEPPPPREQQLTEHFVDGALTVGSPSAGLAGYAVVPFSPEELADRVCRRGASLPRYATEVSGDRLQPADVDFAKEVLQRHCLPLYLACKQRGEQQWGLRSWMKGITLTLMDRSGTESRVTSPSKLIALAQQQQQQQASAAAGSGGHDAMISAATLRMVMDGGWGEAVALLEHVQKRPEATLRWLSVRRVSSEVNGSASRSHPLHAATSAAATAGSSRGGVFSSTSVRVQLLRRAEESALFRIFQSHPSALLLSGCGAQRLALLPTAHAVARSGSSGGGGGVPRSSASLSCTLLLIRVCGVAVEWDLQECYEKPKLHRLREPRRLSFNPSGDAVSGKCALWPPLPAELASAAERVSLRHVRGMLQYYLRSLTSSAASPAADGDDSARTRKRERTADLEESPGVEAAAGASTAVPRSSSDVEASPGQTDADDAALEKAPRTALYPIDRAALLYVVRHHPHYFEQVMGCGISEVYVAAVPAVGVAEAGQPSSLSTNASDAAGSPSSEAIREQSSPVPPLTAAAAAAAASTVTPTLRAALVVERFCGQWVEVDVEACYDKGREGRPLRPCLVLT